MAHFFTVILFQPFLNLLVGLYNLLWNDVGLAVLAVVIIIRGILWPLFHKQLHTQRAMLELQPKLDAVKQKYKDNKEEQAKAIMELYKNEKVSPFSSCLPLLVQLPLLIALYRALSDSLQSKSLDLLYGFVKNPGHLSTTAFGFVDLSKASIPLAILAAAAQFVQAKMMQSKKGVPSGKDAAGKDGKDEDMAAMMNKQMLYMMPAMTLFIGWKLPAGLTLYWCATTIFMVVQQYVFMRGHKHREQGVDKV